MEPEPPTSQRTDRGERGVLRLTAADTLSPPLAAAYAFVVANPGCTIQSVAVHARVSHSTATYYLTALSRRGLIMQLRQGRDLRHFAGAAPQPGLWLRAVMADPRRARIIQFLAAGPIGSSINVVAKRADVSFGLAKRTLEQLHGMGLLALTRRGFRYTMALTPLCRSILGGAEDWT